MAFNALPPATSTTSCGNGDSDGDGCRRGLAEIDGDGLGVRNGPGGDNIPAKIEREQNKINMTDTKGALNHGIY